MNLKHVLYPHDSSFIMEKLHSLRLARTARTTMPRKPVTMQMFHYDSNTETETTKKGFLLVVPDVRFIRRSPTHEDMTLSGGI